MRSQRWIQWSPPWATHVKGEYTERVRGDDGRCEPQKVRMTCTFTNPEGVVCGATWQTTCASGNVCSHINNFAKAHAHQDFANPPLVVRPNSKRASVLEANKHKRGV